jgi:hypothetical protein
MSEEIKSLEEYRALEAEFKGLLTGLGSMGDLVDQQSAVTEAKATMEKISSIKDRLSEYRSAHPEEFKN